MAGTDFKKIRKELNVPWINENGEFDYSKYPIDHPVKDAFSIVEQTFINACRILGNMAHENRMDAGIFLIGLIVYYKHDIERVEILLESLKHFEDELCINFLLDEMSNIEIENAKSKYIDLIINVLNQLPQEMIKEKVRNLITNEKFANDLRNKFLKITGTNKNRNKIIDDELI